MSGWHIFWLVIGIIWLVGLIFLGIAAYLAPSEEDLWDGPSNGLW